MARTVAPGTPAETKAQHFDVNMPDFSLLEKMGDAKINAGIKNAELYAEALITSESQKLYNQFKNDPINLMNALGKLPEMLTDVPEEVRNAMTKKLYLNSVALVQKAENNQTVLQDKQNKQNAGIIIANSKQEIVPAYMNLLQNNITPAEEKQSAVVDIFLSHLDNLQTLSGLKDSNGLDVYTEKQKKQIRNVADVELQGFKRFVDTMILNDNDKLDKTKDYYQKHVLAPERFMAENYMNQETYEKARKYIQDQMKARAVEVKKLKFNQSVQDAIQLQVMDLPGKLKALKEAGLIDKKIINQIEDTNVKFSNIDPAKEETPIAMLNALQIIASQDYKQAPTTEAEQQKILEQGVATLDIIAEYGQTYGLSPRTLQTSRETVANIETNTAFKPILDNFRDIISNFDTKFARVRERSKGFGFKNILSNITNLDGVSDDETIKLIQLNRLLAGATDNINQLIRNGNWDGVRQEQKRVQQQAAQIKYDWIDWEEYQKNPDIEIKTPNGRVVKIKNFTLDGDILFEVLN